MHAHPHIPSHTRTYLCLHAHEHTRKQTLQPTHTQMHWHTYAFTLSRIYARTHNRMHPHSHSNTLAHTVSSSHTDVHTHIHLYVGDLPAHSPMHTRTVVRPQNCTHSLTIPHAFMHTHTRICIRKIFSLLYALCLWNLERIILTELINL